MSAVADARKARRASRVRASSATAILSAVVCRAPTASGEHTERSGVVARRGRHVDERLLDPLPGWGGVELDLRSEVRDPMQTHPRRLCQRPVAVDGDVDAPVLIRRPRSRGVQGAQRRDAVERGRPSGEHRGPGALIPGEWAGVRDTGPRDAGTCPLTPTDQAPDVVVGQTGVQRLASTDDLRLSSEQALDVAASGVHRPSLGVRGCRRQ